MNRTRKWTSDVKRGDHVIQVCRSEADKLSAAQDIAAYVREKEKLFLFTDSEKMRSGLIKRSSVGAQGTGDLIQTVRAGRTMCPKEKFDPAFALDVLKAHLDDAVGDGYRSIVAVFDMSWLAKRPEDFNAYMHVEMSINLLRFPTPVTILCQYEGSLFSSEQLDMVSSLHALSLTDGMVKRSFWLIPRHMDLAGTVLQKDEVAGREHL